MEHTKEPWAVCSKAPNEYWRKGRTIHYYNGGEAGGIRIADAFDIPNAEANARRIVACVNELAGVENPTGYVHRIERQRDELLAALKELLSAAEASFGHDQGDLFGYEEDAIKQAKEAIAEVEQS